MDNNCSKQINKKPLFLQPPSNNNSHYKVPQPIASKKNNEKNGESNIIDYKNISLTMTGEISSANIHRNDLTQKQLNTFYMEDENTTEDDDEQFVLNMKKIIDKNYRMQNKENYSIKDLQSKLYLSRKKKCAFSDEDQNLMKRFKRSVAENRALCVAPRKLQQSENVASVNNRDYCTVANTPQFSPTVAPSNIDTNFGNNTNQFLFHASKTQKNDQTITSNNTKVVTETEIEQLIYYEMQYFTPPQRDDGVIINNHDDDNL